MARELSYASCTAMLSDLDVLFEFDRVSLTSIPNNWLVDLPVSDIFTTLTLPPLLLFVAWNSLTRLVQARLQRKRQRATDLQSKNSERDMKSKSSYRSQTCDLQCKCRLADKFYLLLSVTECVACLQPEEIASSTHLGVLYDPVNSFKI
jgi:hypothetical protein